MGPLGGDDLCKRPASGAGSRDSLLTAFRQVLGVCIVLVFCVGLFKLWWTNRSVRKQELIDEEKKAHLTEMRKTGLSPKSPKKSEVPFGVRALQRGIEVDGIWVSRPGTPSRNSSRSKLHSLTILEIDEKGETRTKYVSEPRSTRPHRTPSGAATKEGAGGSETAETRSMLSMHLPQISEDSTLPEKQRVKGRLNEEALRRLEGQTAKGAMMNTYIPSSGLPSPHSTVSRSHYKPSKRSSVSSTESISESSGSHHPSSSSSQRSFTGPGGAEGKPARGNPAHAYTGSGRSPPRSPKRSSTATSSTFQTGSSSDSHSPLLANLTMPPPTFGAGGPHANRHARRVNPGFEVLPAGTFGPPHDLSRSPSGGSHADEGESLDGLNRTNKLRKQPGHSVGQAI